MKTLEIPCKGYSVVADLYTTENSKGTILELIGYTSNRKKYVARHTELDAATKMDSLVFDYSGHGDSPFDLGEIMPAQNFLEVITVFDWLKEHNPKGKVTVIGSSYGGYLATQLTKYRSFDNLILRAPAIYQPSDFYTKQKNIDREWTRKVFRKDPEALAKHPLLTRASFFKGKTLVVVHQNDNQVSKETTDAYIKAFGADVYEATGFPHSLDEVTDSQKISYYKKIADWLNQQ